MPTKASEYMISGTPIIVFCNCNLSIYKHAEKYNWAYLIGSNDVELLKMGIMDLIESISKRESFAKKAIQFASENFDDVKVRQEFHQIFIDCCKK
jgi:hypothetical protein